MTKTRLTFLVLTIVILLSTGQSRAAQTGQPLAVITEPGDNAIVQDTIEIRGSADHPQFNYYVIEVAPEPINESQWLFIGDGQAPVVNGRLSTWDTTAVPDGSYTLRLRVVKIDGNYDEAYVRQIVVTNTRPLPTDTPTPPKETPTPTTTPTPLPPTPTIAIEQPVVDTPTPRPAVPTSPPLEDPDEKETFIPTVTGFSASPLRDACLYGVGAMLSLFLLFGFLAALRTFVIGLIQMMKQRQKG